MVETALPHTLLRSDCERDGISAMKLSEMIRVIYKVAWNMGHRIRSMMAAGHILLSGVVEIDEISAGAPPRQPHGGPWGVPSGLDPRRPLVLTMVERGGNAVMKTIASLWPRLRASLRVRRASCLSSKSAGATSVGRQSHC